MHYMGFFSALENLKLLLKNFIYLIVTLALNLEGSCHTEIINAPVIYDVYRVSGSFFFHQRSTV